MDHVGRRVRTGDGLATSDVDSSDDGCVLGDLTLADLTSVHEDAGNRRLDVVDLEQRAVGHRDRTMIAQLAAGFGVERRAIQDHLGVLASAGHWLCLPVRYDTDDDCVGDDLVVPDEGRRSPRLEDVAVSGGRCETTLARSRVGLGALALLRHQGAETLLVDSQPLLGRHLQRQIDREAVSVVQRESLVARKGGGTGPLGLRDRSFE